MQRQMSGVCSGQHEKHMCALTRALGGRTETILLAFPEFGHGLVRALRGPVSQ